MKRTQIDRWGRKSHEERHSETVTHAEGVGEMIRRADGPVPLWLKSSSCWRRICDLCASWHPMERSNPFPACPLWHLPPPHESGSALQTSDTQGRGGGRGERWTGIGLRRQEDWSSSIKSVNYCYVTLDTLFSLWSLGFLI